MRWQLVGAAISIAAGFPVYSHAQDQETLGACSPAINQTSGDVAVTCIMPDRRIKIAKFDAELESPEGRDQFNKFAFANSGKIVRIETRVYKLESHGSFMETTQENKNRGLIGIIHINEDPQCLGGALACTGTDYNLTEKNQDEPGVYWQHGSYVVNGYFLIGTGGGTYQGWTQVALRHIDDDKILLSSNYIAN